MGYDIEKYPYKPPNNLLAQWLMMRNPVPLSCSKMDLGLLLDENLSSLESWLGILRHGRFVLPVSGNQGGIDSSIKSF